MKHPGLKALKSGVPCEWLLRALGQRGVGLTDIRQYLPIEENLLTSPGRVLPRQLYNALFEWGAQRTGDPCLGIHIAEAIEFHQFGIFGFLVSNAATLRDWSELVEQYHCIFTPEFSFTFKHLGRRCRCEYHVGDSTPEEARQDIDFSLASTVHMILRHTSSDWQPQRCTFTYSAPSDLSEHRRFFGSNLHFGQATNSLEFSEELLSIPIATADPNLLLILKQQANQLLQQLSSKQNLVNHVSLLITAGLGHENLSTATVAGKLNMSVRSLHRQLREHDTSYRQLRDAIVLQVAKEALLDTRANITDIALKLGYSEASAFVRVFKRLAGVSPLQFRKHAAGG